MKGRREPREKDDVKITMYYDRRKPFADLASAEGADALLAAYERELESALRERFSDDEVVVRGVERAPGDVEFEPEDALSPERKLELALEVKRIAHRLADETLAAFQRGRAEQE